MKKIMMLLIVIGTLGSCNLAKMVTNISYTDGDLNQDGFLTFEEYWSLAKDDTESKQKAESKGLVYKDKAKKDFEYADTTKDSKLSKTEYKNFMSKVFDGTYE